MRICRHLYYSCRLLSIIGLAHVLCFDNSAFAGEIPPVQSLAAGQTVERELRGDEAHLYRIEAVSGQYFRIEVDQLGVDVSLELRDPDGKILIETDGPFGDKGAEVISLTAEKSGSYSLEVRGSAPAGRYRARLRELRAAVPQDATRISAEQIMREALHLFMEGTPASTKRASEKYAEAHALWQTLDDREQLVVCLFFEGVLKRHAGDLPVALDRFDEALAICRAIGDRVVTASVLRETAKVFLNRRDRQKALDYYQQAVTFSAGIGDRREQAEGLNDIGWVYKAASEHQRALDQFQQARMISRDAGNLEMEGSALNNLALTYFEMSELQKALDCLLQALPLKRQSGHKQGEGVILNGIGLVYQQLGDYQKSLDYFSQALPLWHGIDNGRFEAIALHGIGASYLELGDYAKAVEYLTRALELERTVKDRGSEATTLMALSSLSFRIGNHTAALEYDKTALEICRGMGNLQRETVALNRVAWVSGKLGDLEGARRMLSQVVSMADSVGDLKEKATALNGMAHIEYEMGDYAGAQGHIEAALGIIESIRGKIASRDIRTSYFASIRQYYKFYIDLLMKLNELHPSAGYDRAALQANERALARNLLEALKQPYSEVRRGVDAELLDREKTLKRQLNARGEEQIRLLTGKHTDQQASSARWEIEHLTTELEAAQGRIRAQNPRYAALTQPVSLTVEQIQRQVLDSNTVLLEYALGERKSYLWAITRESMASFELDSPAEIDATGREVYRLLTERNRRIRFETEEERRDRLARADADYVKSAGALSRMLLKPLTAGFRKKRLIIVADETLQYIPFAALPDPSSRSQPLILRHEIVSLPSASTLALIRQETAGRNPAPNQIAIIGDPVYDSSDARLQPHLAEVRSPAPNRAQPRDVAGGLRFARLGFTRHEAAAIASLANPGKVMLALDFNASRETAIGPELAQYRMIHIAAHGLLDTQAPDRSAVVLSLVDKQGRPQNGFVRLQDIYDLNLPSELVVLSACQTALGRRTSGEGLVGLTRGFMYAGSRRVMASLWKVADQATAELMKAFYKATLDKGQSAAAALRTAQLELRRHPNWRAPFFWGSFTLQGEYK